eukprot:TRINITY_DN1663_c1_g1_i1.p3 TRINITY_DN1663_c1_g1~~TRINITY_DN1663_c1_g1_i1.p3  ORF type:complete len:763 (-),score=200.14 TRINITY_DN1663_c1_g1_i1:8136-10424(-)
MTIKQKLYLTGFIALAALAAVFTVNYIGTNLIEKAMRASENALNAEVDMLQARRREKDFIERRDMQYVDQVQNYVANARKSLEPIASMEGVYADKASKAQTLLGSYHDHFMQVAEAVETLGLSEELGLRGTLRNAVHSVEDVVTKRDDDALLADMLMLRRREKDFIIRGDHKYLDKFNTDLETMRAEVANAETLGGALKAQVDELLGKYADAFRQYVQHSEALQADREALSSVTSELQPLLDEMANYFIQQANARQASLLKIMLIVELAAALLLLTGIISTIRSIMRPLHSLQRCTQEVVDGNHDACTLFSYTGELEVLRQAMATMVANLKKSMDEAQAQSDEAKRQTQHAQEAMQTAQAEKEHVAELVQKMAGVAQRASVIAGNLAESADELSTQADQMSSGASLQQERVSETATAMEEMNATVLEVARNAASAAEGADSARDMATEGSQIVSRVVEASNEVATVSETMKGNLAELGSQAENIGAILSVITDIADQTNLLALNAAIEAARAGEEGRGFAVVADEVRKLAEKTMSATSDVTKAIKNIQDATHKNIDGTIQSVDIITQVTKQANESGESLQHIVSLVNDATGQVQSIATAADQHSAASEEINQSITHISEISGETSQAMDSSKNVVMDLSELVKTLNSLTERMKAQRESILTTLRTGREASARSTKEGPRCCNVRAFFLVFSWQYWGYREAELSSWMIPRRSVASAVTFWIACVDLFTPSVVRMEIALISSVALLISSLAADCSSAAVAMERT